MEYGNRILPYLRIFLSYLRTKIILPEIEFTFESTFVRKYESSTSVCSFVRKYFRESTKVLSTLRAHVYRGIPSKVLSYFRKYFRTKVRFWNSLDGKS